MSVISNKGKNLYLHFFVYVYIFFYKYFLLESSCFKMLGERLLFSKMNQPYIYIYFFPFRFPSHLGYHFRCIKRSSLYYTVCSHQLSILYTVSIVCMCRSQSPDSSHLPSFPLISLPLFSTSVPLLLLCKLDCL